MSRVIDYALTRGVGAVRARNGGRRYGSDHDLVEFDVDGLRVALWNPRRGRNDSHVVDLIDGIMATRDLDALLLCEATEYVDNLRRAQHNAPWRVLANSARPGADEVAIILRDGLTFARFDSRRLAADGWFTSRGHRVAPRHLAAVDVRVGHTCTTLAVTHFPPSGRWRLGRLVGPRRRVLATRRQARNLVTWANHYAAHRLVLAADWNETPSTRGRWSPHWIARRAGLHVVAPRQGTHGRDRQAARS